VQLPAGPLRCHSFELACAQNDIDHRLTNTHYWHTPLAEITAELVADSEKALTDVASTPHS
jgi:hypothetical protein